MKISKLFENIYSSSLRESISVRYDADWKEFNHNWTPAVEIRDQPSDREVFNSKLVAEKIRNTTDVWFVYFVSDGHYDGGVYTYHKIPEEMFPKLKWEQYPLKNLGSFIDYNGTHYMRFGGLRGGPADPRETGVRDTVYSDLIEEMDYRFCDDFKDFTNIVGKHLPGRNGRYDAKDLTPEEMDGIKWIYENRQKFKQDIIDAYEDAVAYWYQLRDEGAGETNKRVLKVVGYVAYVHGDEIVATGKTRSECENNAECEGYDNEEYVIHEVTDDEDVAKLFL